jgi:hypothetical protein
MPICQCGAIPTCCAVLFVVCLPLLLLDGKQPHGQKRKRAAGDDGDEQEESEGDDEDE